MEIMYVLVILVFPAQSKPQLVKTIFVILEVRVGHKEVNSILKTHCGMERGVALGTHAVVLTTLPGSVSSCHSRPPTTLR